MPKDSEGSLDERLTGSSASWSVRKQASDYSALSLVAAVTSTSGPVRVPYSTAASWFALNVFSNGGWTAVQHSTPTIGQESRASFAGGCSIITKQN